jgi:hypothetical protein
VAPRDLVELLERRTATGTKADYDPFDTERD